MIPKVIHYCWFGKNPLPPLALKCIASWKKFFPDYEIKEWNEDNFNVNIIPYTQEAYTAKKYAFVSDYARFWILYNYGGLYFDTDVEIIKSFEDILSKGPFMGAEKSIRHNNDKIDVAAGLGLGANKGMTIYKDILDYYSTLHFLDKNGTMIPKTVCHIVTEKLEEKGLKHTNDIQTIDGITIYPAEYFNPIDFVTRRLHINKYTHSIHWYMASWEVKTWKKNIKRLIRSIFPETWLLWYNKNLKK